MNIVDVFGKIMIYAIVAVIVYRLFLEAHKHREKIKAFTMPILKKLFPPIKKEQPTLPSEKSEELTINGIKYTKVKE